MAATTTTTTTTTGVKPDLRAAMCYAVAALDDLAFASEHRENDRNTAERIRQHIAELVRALGPQYDNASLLHFAIGEARAEFYNDFYA